jgi:hypothetical protein
MSLVTQIDNTGADMAFVDEQRWQGKIFDGTWRRADGGERPVVEPATGDKLGTVGFAALSDLERSALRHTRPRCPGPRRPSGNEQPSCAVPLSWPRIGRCPRRALG